MGCKPSKSMSSHGDLNQEIPTVLSNLTNWATSSPTTVGTITKQDSSLSSTSKNADGVKSTNGASISMNAHHIDHLLTIPRGYSSGASSDSESVSEAPNPPLAGWENLDDPIGLPRVRLTSHDITTDMRNELVAEGDISKAVIRIETPFGKPIQDAYTGVLDGPVLGSGFSGIVRLCTHRATSVQYAVKCLDLGLLVNQNGNSNEKALKRLREEIFIMCQLDHPNIVRLEEVYESSNELYLLSNRNVVCTQVKIGALLSYQSLFSLCRVQELCLGGDLFDRLDEQPDYHYTEAECARLVKQMLSSIRYLHSKNIIHRDLKLENFLFSSTDPDSELKMIDFGLSKHFIFGEVFDEAVGTPYTVAPEILRGSYNEKCDIWALGVITYLLLCGETPFGGDSAGDNMVHVRTKILSGSFQFRPADIWENVSPMAKNFVQLCLNPDPSKRPTAKELQKNEWIQVCARKGVDNGNSRLKPNVVKALVGFKEYTDMRKLLCEVLSFTLLPEQIVELRAEFEKIDTEGSGEISLSALKQVLMENAEAGSLGALTEQEIQEIFNSLRVRQSQPMIRWHEFIAAGLSQCIVDDRNLRLAFDRLDIDRKGFICIEDIAALIGSSKNQEAVRRMWLDEIAEGTPSERITYDDFLKIMKGQGQPKSVEPPRASYKRLRSSNPESSPRLGPVPEGDVSPCPQYGVVDAKRLKEMGGDALSLPSLLDFGGEMPDTFKPFGRRRSQSFEHRQDSHWVSDGEEDPVRPLGSDKGGHGGYLSIYNDIRNVISDDSMTPLATNRVLYRKHREMRLAVLEASKQFDLVQHARRRQSDHEGSHKAGLVMRRGTMEHAQNMQMEDARRNEELDNASRRAGRGGKHARKKTISDMSGLMALEGVALG